ncbi:MAG TPA: hypothetical protein VN711_02235 [Candidatus Saccharimonadales bacterium]|nr:hypothetical protein [Candidatus Saccharimonadales bacterium]
MTNEGSPQEADPPEQPETPTRPTIFDLAKGFNTAGDRLRVAIRTGESRETTEKFLRDRREQKRKR